MMPDIPNTAPDRSTAASATPDSEADPKPAAAGEFSHAGAASAPTLNTARKKWKRTIAVLLVLLTAAGGGYKYWHYRTLHPQTGDAYLNAHVVRVSPQIAGPVRQVLVGNHQHVEQGELLLEIDPEPFEIAVEQAEAQRDLAIQEAAAAEAAVDAAHAEVVRQQAVLKDVEKNTGRTLALVSKGTLAMANGDSARAALKETEAALAATKAGLQRALKQLGASGKHNARVRAASAAVAKAQLELSHTKIVAPAAGIVGEIAIRPSAMVEPGQALFPLVEDGSFWIDANYKETDLERIEVGQPSTVTVDLYPNRTFEAVVDSISPASGAAFSLLPPENATGNWVKVTQRFPVRLRILETDPSHPLRIGASCAVTIDTTSRGR